MRARPTCSCAAEPVGPSRPSSPPATRRSDDYFGNSVSLSGDTAVVGAQMTTTRAARCGLGLRVRAQRNQLDRAGEAHRQRRGGRRLLRQLRQPFGRHGRGRGLLDDHAGRHRCGLGLRVRPQRNELDRAGEAHRQRRGGQRPLRHLRQPLGRHGRGRGRQRRPRGRLGCGLGLRVRPQRNELDRAGEAHRQRRGEPSTTSATPSAFRATRPWSEPTGTTTRAASMRARPTCSSAAERVGPSR